MKITLAILFVSTLLAAETKTEAELKKQNAALQSALAAERAEKATSKASTQKLVEAVRDATETTKESGEKVGEKVDAVADRILESQVSGAKAVERATQSAAKKITDVVTNQTSVITAQTKQQEKLLAQARESTAQAREAARRLADSNRALAKTAEENRIAKEENAKQLIAVRADLKEMKFNQAIAAAKDDTALRMQRYKLISDVSTPFIQALGAVLLALVVVFQIRASKQASATHTMVNGERTKMLKEIEDLKKRIERGDDRENGHAST